MQEPVIIGAPQIRTLFPNGIHMLACLPRAINTQQSVRLLRTRESSPPNQLASTSHASELLQAAAAPRGQEEGPNARAKLVALEVALTAVRAEESAPRQVRETSEGGLEVKINRVQQSNEPPSPSPSPSSRIVTFKEQAHEQEKGEAHCALQPAAVTTRDGGVIKRRHEENEPATTVEWSKSTSTPRESSSSSSKCEVEDDDDEEEESEKEETRAEENEGTPLDQLAAQEQRLVDLARRIVNNDFKSQQSSSSSSSSSVKRPARARVVVVRRLQQAERDL